MLKHEPGQMVSIDISPKLVDRLSQRFPATDAAVADLLDLAPGLGDRAAPFDVIVSSEVIEHTADPRGAIEQLSHYVKEDGFMVLSVPNRRWK